MDTLIIRNVNFLRAKLSRYKKKLVGERSEYIWSGKVSYAKSVSFYSIILVTYSQALSWSKIMTKYEK